MTNLDEALERFHLVDLEYAGGLANHGPMGAEALESLGHQALIPAFVDLYVPRLPVAEVGSAMSDVEAESALGRIDRRADWVATFESKLAGGDWRAVVSGALPSLMPGVFAGAGHGLLRTAHAVRCLEREDSPLRRRELARGLAYWSARFQVLPGLPGSRAVPGHSMDDFFSELPLVGEPEARVGFFFESVKRLDSLPAFAKAIERMPRPADADVDSFLGELGRRATLLYCAHRNARIAYVHTLTLVSALRGLSPYFSSEFDAQPDPLARSQAALYVLQAVSALHSIHGEHGDAAGLAAEFDDEVRESSGSWDEIRYRAACSIQEHAIKMAEACWRADRAEPDPIYRLAAADAALRIEASVGGSSC